MMVRDQKVLKAREEIMESYYCPYPVGTQKINDDFGSQAIIVIIAKENRAV